MNKHLMRLWIALLIPVVAVTLLSVPALSDQREDKQRARKIQKEEAIDKEASKQRAEASKVPEGAIVKGNAVTLKSGYKFGKQSGGSVVVQRTNGGVTGEFKCSCKSSATTKGACDFGTIGGDTAKCFSSGCSDCLLETIVKPSKAAASKVTAPSVKKQ